MALIGINGYIGSGKDTVGKIIQWHCRPKVQCSLETWLATDDSYRAVANWKIKKFAGKLKQIASLMLGVPVERFEDQEFKKTELGPEWSTLHEFMTSEQEQVQRMTVREFLQKLGTEAIRHGLHSEAWVNALFADYKVFIEGYPQLTKSNGQDLVAGTMYGMGRAVAPNWIITDMRFPNEMKAVKDRGGITVRVNRQLAEAPYQTLEQRHPSETSLDGERFDHIIENNDTIEQLTDRVKQILEYSGIIPVYPVNKRSVTFERDNGTRENWNKFQDRYPESAITFEQWYDDHVAAGNKQVEI